MADNSQLRAQLEDLDNDLADGDITRKGWEKRRTLLLEQYLDRGLEQRDPSPATRSPSTPSFAQQRTPSIADQLGPLSPGETFVNHAPQPLKNGHTNYSRVEGQLGVANPTQRRSISGAPSLQPPSDSTSSQDGLSSRNPTMSRSEYAFNPMEQPQSQVTSQIVGVDDNRASTMLDSQQNYFSDFAGQQMPEQPQRESYGGPNRYSMGETLSPGANPPPLSNEEVHAAAMISHLLPLEPRDVPFSINDPHDRSIPMSKFESLGAVLRHRGKANAKQPAFWVLDPKGREITSITWDKFASRAEKLAQVIRDKSGLYRGDRVALIYRDTEIIDFAIALLGCFISGVVAVPVNCIDDYQKLNMLLTTTQAHLALTTDNNLKNFQRDITANKLRWPAGVEWWKTNEFGGYHPKKKEETPALQVPDLAYIEFSRAPTGDIRGVVLSHRTIMHQMACISAVVSTTPHEYANGKDSFNPSLRDRDGNFVVQDGNHGETILSYLDPREGIGLILGVLFGVYGGHTTIWMQAMTVDTAGLYAHLITRYHASILVADYSRLKFAAYNYQQDPMTTRNFKKGTDPNFSAVKLCLIDTLTVDTEFHGVLADRWFKPLRNNRAREVVAPMLCLPEHGGMIVSIRDWLGGEERMGCPLSSDAIDEDDDDDGERSPDGNDYNHGFNSLTPAPKQARLKVKRNPRTELSELLLDKEALKTNEVVVLAMGEEARRRANEPGTIKLGGFGYPIPDATLAVVDPETSLLCPPFTIGEIWVDSPSLSGGFWSLPRHTETIFHARPLHFADGSPTPVFLDMEFLRTGLLGFVVEGKVYILGLYEDRIRQKVEWVEDGVQDTEHRYFFVQHLVSIVAKNIPKIHDCSAFDVYVNGEYLPIILIETLAASTAPLVPGGPPRQLDLALLDSLSERCMEVLYNEHHLRVYCVMITAPNTLPKVVKNGRKDIGNMLCRRDFDNGSLPCVHVRFGVERAVQNLPLGDDPMGGIWSQLATHIRGNILMMNEKQYSGVDHREVVMDDRTSTPLNQFTNIEDLLQWRVSRQAEELAYCTVDSRGREGKGLNWKKMDQKIAAVAMYLRNKVKVQQGDHLLLMYTHSEDFVYAIHACFVLGAIAIPIAPLDERRLSEDAPALLSMIGEYRVKAILVNGDVDQMMKQKTVSQHIKQSAMILRVNLPNFYNTTKPPKQNHGCRELGLTIRPAWTQPGYPVLVWVYWTPDQRRMALQLGHNTIMALCKVQKETCQMHSTRPVLSCVRSTMGLGFIHMCLMGIYLAAPTYLVSPVDFAQNPMSLFLTLSRYKIKDTYATSQMLDHAMANIPGKGFAMHELKNLMISSEGRPRSDVYQRVRMHFAQAGLDRTAINTIYSHIMNPMIASRSYMCVEPIEICLDMKALRRGLVLPVDSDLEPQSLLVQDSGMVPVSTQISIVNPETNRLCYVGEYGEIWVQSEACAHRFYMSNDPLDAERFNARREDGDPQAPFVRTGDLGFLHNVSRPIGPGGALVEMQVLFVLGSIGETFDVNGLSHFPMDIENSIEKCHRNIVPSGCAVFQAGGLVVILVEVMRKNFLASIVPVIVNAVLNAHQLVPDLVAFVARGDFPRSRLGEKQRGKILAGWVTRKMRTIAQFGIKDPNEQGDPRASSSSFRGNSIRGSSLKHVESVTAMQELAENDYGESQTDMSSEDSHPVYDNDSIMHSPPAELADNQEVVRSSEDTPTAPSHPQLPLHQGAYFDGAADNLNRGASNGTPQPRQGNASYLELPEMGSLMGDNGVTVGQYQGKGHRRESSRSSESEKPWRQEFLSYSAGPWSNNYGDSNQQR